MADQNERPDLGIAKDLSILRRFHARRFNAPCGDYSQEAWEERNAYLRQLGADMLAWARTVNTANEAQGLEDAVRRAAACTILACESAGFKPGWEVLIFPPEQTTHEGSGMWRICWESGPYGWGVGSGVVPARYREGANWYTEPHFSFDLCWVPS